MAIDVCRERGAITQRLNESGAITQRLSGREFEVLRELMEEVVAASGGDSVLHAKDCGFHGEHLQEVGCLKPMQAMRRT